MTNFSKEAIGTTIFLSFKEAISRGSRNNPIKCTTAHSLIILYKLKVGILYVNNIKTNIIMLFREAKNTKSLNTKKSEILETENVCTFMLL
jgi:hypothetical protein